MSSHGFERAAIKRIEVVLLTLILCLAACLVVPAIRRSRVGAARQACLANLGRIGQAFGQYLDENERRWPHVAKLASVRMHDPRWPTLPAVLASHLGDEAEVFRCPADRRALPSDSPLRDRFSAKTTYYETEGTSYEYWMGEAYAGRKVGEESLSKATGFGLGRADQPLLSDFEPFHKGDGGGAFNTLNADLKPRTTRSRKNE